MTYAKIENGLVVEYPVYEGEIKLRYPNVSFPEQFEAPKGYEFVENVPCPQIDYTQNLALGEPVYIEGVLTQVWVVTDASDEEIADREQTIRNTNESVRNGLLGKTDWTQLADVDLTADCKAAFAAYRKELRSIDLLNPVWPDAPEEQWSE